MRIVVDNDIRISQPNDLIVRYCKEKLVLNNPEYYKRQKMGKWTGNINPTICLYERHGEDVYIPFGCFADVWKLHTQKEDYSISDHFVDAEKKVDYDSNIQLYDYQDQAVTLAIKKKNGILVMPCGAGKTQTALEIISRIGGKALWLTHTQDLLNQSMNRAKSVYDIPAEAYGTITGGKINIGSAITFATVQTMSKIDLKQYKDCWDIVVVDECHKAVGSPTKVMQFYLVLSNLCCRYKYGLTATPKRSDGLERSMFALLGDIICEVSKEAVADTTCPVEVRTVETGYTPDLDVALNGDGTINYASIVQDMTSNKERFEFVSTVCQNCADDGATLVLGNRVEYLKALSDTVQNSICLSGMGNSKSAKEKRKQTLKNLNDGEINAVFATYSLAAEGLDCPNLRYLVLATPEKDPTRIQQSTGRVGRKSEGKKLGVVVDLLDDFGMFYGWHKKRLSIYKRLGYDII